VKRKSKKLPAGTVIVLYMLDIYQADEKLVGIFTSHDLANNAKSYFRAKLEPDQGMGTRLYFRKVLKSLDKTFSVKY
jgi:hypothetical protein